MSELKESYKALGGMMEELRRLHDETHPERQPGEFTIAEYFQANQERVLTQKRAAMELEYMRSIGRLTKPPLRFIDGKMRAVYKIV